MLGVYTWYDNSDTAQGVESPSVGSHNTFEARSRVPSSIRISDYCTIGAACTAFPSASFSQIPKANPSRDISEPASAPDSDASMLSVSSPAQPPPENDSQSQSELLPSHTVIYGASSERRIWSGNGKGQATALYAKHLEYLREVRLSPICPRGTGWPTNEPLPIRCFQNMPD
jgi:dynactin-6